MVIITFLALNMIVIFHMACKNINVGHLRPIISMTNINNQKNKYFIFIFV